MFLNPVNVFDYVIQNSSDVKYKNPNSSLGTTSLKENRDISFSEILKNLTGEDIKTKEERKKHVKSYVEYSHKTFDKSVENSYNDIYSKGISLDKVYTGLKSSSKLTEDQEFELLFRTLLRQAAKGFKPAQDALVMIDEMFSKIETKDRNPKDVFAEMMKNIKKQIKSFDPKLVKSDEALMMENLSIITRLIENEFSGGLSFEKLLTEDENEEYINNKIDKVVEESFITQKYKEIKKTKSTKIYVKEKEILDQTDSKLQKITELKYSQNKVLAQDEINKLVTEIGTLGLETNKDNLIILDISKFNKDIQSPMFA